MKGQCGVQKKESFVSVIRISNRELHFLRCLSHGDAPKAEVCCHTLYLRLLEMGSWVCWCETCHVPAAQMGGGCWCNKPVVALVTQLTPGLCLLHSLGGVMQTAKKGWVRGELAFNLCPEVHGIEGGFGICSVMLLGERHHGRIKQCKNRRGPKKSTLK